MPSSTETIPRIVLFGGTFDPPHEGHADCVRVVLAHLPDTELRIVPAAQPAGAAGVHKQPVASYTARMDMCALAFESISPRVRVVPWERDLPKPNYTVQTLAKAAELCPGRRLGLLLGQDQLESFHLWREPMAILERAALIVVARAQPSGLRSSLTSLKALVESLAQRLRLDLAWSMPSSGALVATLSGTTTTRIFLIGGELCAAASHLIRSAFDEGRPPEAGWIAPAVAQYIRDNALYPPRISGTPVKEAES